MKKTYKTNNGENRSYFFRVGRKLVAVRFLPTFTTENPMVHAAIEKSIAFREGIQLVTPSMTWIKIARDKNGLMTSECYSEMLDSLYEHLCLVVYADARYNDYLIVTQEKDVEEWFGEVAFNERYTHYLPIKTPEE